MNPGTATVVEVPAPGVRMAVPKGKEVIVELPANATVPAEKSQLDQPNPYMSEAQAMEMGFEFDWTSDAAMSRSRSMFRTAGSLVAEFISQMEAKK